MVKSREDEITGLTGTLAADTTSDAIVDLGPYDVAVVHLITGNLALADLSDELDFYLQTTYDGGSNWVDVEQIHFANADNGNPVNVLFVVSPPQSSAVARVRTDGALGDDTKLDLPLGTGLRLKLDFTIVGTPSVAGVTAKVYLSGLGN